MIIRSEFKDLLELQVQTNVAYMGENWYNVWSNNSLRNSIYREYAEMLDEIETHWHCYKPTPKFDRSAAVFELVDVVHFMLALLVMDSSPEELAADVNYPKACVTSGQESSLSQVECTFSAFMYTPCPWYFVIFLSHACRMLGIDTQQYIKAHMLKNSRNRARAAGGVIDGKYDKSKETPLTMEF